MSNLTEHAITAPGTGKRTIFRKFRLLKRSVASPGIASPEMKPDAPSLILCSSLDELLFTDWIICSCDHDYSSLIISGTATEDQITQAWIRLVSEYQTLTDAKEAESHREQTIQIEAYNTKILHVTCLMEALQLGYVEELAAELRETWEYDMPFTAESLEKDLRKVAANIGSMKTKLAQLLKRYRDKQDEAGEDTEGMTREMYLQALYSIEESKKMEFDLTKLTTSKFAIMLKQLVDRNKILKAKYSGHGSK